MPKWGGGNVTWFLARPPLPPSWFDVVFCLTPLPPEGPRGLCTAPYSYLALIIIESASWIWRVFLETMFNWAYLNLREKLCGTKKFFLHILNQFISRRFFVVFLSLFFLQYNKFLLRKTNLAAKKCFFTISTEKKIFASEIIFLRTEFVLWKFVIHSFTIVIYSLFFCSVHFI